MADKDPIDIIRNMLEQHIAAPNVYPGGMPAFLLQSYILLRILDKLESIDKWLAGMNSTLDHIEEGRQVL